MRCNSIGLTLIKQCEGLALKAYICPAGVLTIGYGHTGADVHPGQTITSEDAEILLQQDLHKFESVIDQMVAVPLNTNQFSSLCSFVFNIGASNFQRSTLLRHLNKGDYHRAAAEFPRWNRGGGKVLPGLVIRREKEQALFNTPD